MVRKLLITLGAAAILSIVAFAAAWTFAGDELDRKLTDGTIVIWDVGDNSHDQAADVARTLAWNGEPPLNISAPVNLVFTRSPTVSMTVTGPPRAMAALRWNDGNLSLSRDITLRHGGFDVRITGPKLSALRLDGPGNIELRNLDQSALRLDINGTAAVEADGRVDALDIVTNGVGAINLGDLHARTARVKIGGIGSVTLDVSDTVDGSISGVGNLNLERKPRHLSLDQNGIGTVEQTE